MASLSYSAATDSAGLLSKHASQAPSFTGSGGNFHEWEEQFVGWTALYGITITDLSTWKPGTDIPVDKVTNTALYGILLRAFEGTPYTEIMTRCRNTIGVSGTHVWQALQERFKVSKFSDKHRAAIKFLAITRSPSTADFAAWEAELRTSIAHLTRMCGGDLQEMLLALAMGNIPTSSVFASPVNNLNDRTNCDIDEFCSALRSYQDMDQTHREQDAAGSAPSGARTESAFTVATAESEIGELKGMMKTLVTAFKSRGNGNRDHRGGYDPTKCNRCGDPLTGSHTSRT
jgi:hypothetical protein